MRWKLLLLVSLIASLLGSGIPLAIILLMTGKKSAPLESGSVDVLAFSALIIPLATILAASFFVYRHTSRRRKLQAMATALLSAILILTIFFISQLFMTKSIRPQPPQPPETVGSRQWPVGSEEQTLPLTFSLIV